MRQTRPVVQCPFTMEAAMTNQSAVQASGLMLVWANPANTFKKSFLVLDPSCNPDPYPGVVIIATRPQAAGVALTVNNLRKELPGVLSQYPQNAVAFWRAETDDAARTKLLEDLTASPVYGDHSHFFPSRP